MKFKRPLVLVLVLALAMSAVTGGTIAWFTDTVESGANVIKAGNLDIELYHSNKNETDVPVTTSTELFKLPTLWEPGAVAFENLAVTNEGDLALKYKLAMNVTGENFLKDENGNLHGLSTALKVGVVEGGFNTALSREEIVNSVAADKWTTLASFAKEGPLLADAEPATYGVVIYWQPTAEDNKWNVNNGKKAEDGKEYLDITLGVKLEAYQLAHESDSFGPDYDADSSVGNISSNGLIFVGDLMTGEPYTLVDVTNDFVGNTVNVPAGVTALGADAFASNKNIKTVNIPASVTDFGGLADATGTNASGGAFKKSSVEKITLPEGLKEIPDAAFNQAGNLKEVNIPSTVESIGIYAFRGTALHDLTIPASVKKIGYGAFRDMKELTTVTIKGDSIHLPGYAFRSCSNLTSVYLKVDSLTLGDGMIFSTADTGSLHPDLTFYVYNTAVETALKNHDANYNVMLVKPADTTTGLESAIQDGGAIEINGNIAIDEIGAYDFNIGGYAGIGAKATLLGGTITRESSSNHPLYVSTTEKVTFDKVTFESVKGSAVLATRTDGANVTLNDCVFNNQAAPSTGNTGIQVYAKNTTWTFNNCTFNNMPIVTNSSYPEGIKLVFNDCTFTWKGDNCPGVIQIANNLKIQVDINNCKFAYTTDSQYTTAKNMISYNRPEASTININGLEVIGTRNNDKIWTLCSSNNKVTVNTTGELSYTFNGAPVDFATYLK